MKIEDLKQIIELMGRSSLTELEIEEGDLKIRLGKSTSAVVADSISVPNIIQEEKNEAPEAVENIQKGKFEIKAPMVGIFHPAQHEVVVGSRLLKGESICIIEAMKLMNEIEIPQDGEIISVGVKDGDMVEYGQVLFTYN